MNDNIPLVLAVADSLSSSSGLTDLQRDGALQAIESFRALSPCFLDAAQQIISEGSTENAELFSAGTQGARLATTLTKICKALWTLEDDVFAQRSARIAEMAWGKEGTNAAN